MPSRDATSVPSRSSSTAVAAGKADRAFGVTGSGIRSCLGKGAMRYCRCARVVHAGPGGEGAAALATAPRLLQDRGGCGSEAGDGGRICRCRDRRAGPPGRDRADPCAVPSRDRAGRGRDRPGAAGALPEAGDAGRRRDRHPRRDRADAVRLVRRPARGPGARAARRVRLRHPQPVGDQAAARGGAAAGAVAHAGAAGAGRPRRPARLPDRDPGARADRAVPHPVPRCRGPAAGRRGAGARHREPHPGLSARGGAPGAGAVGAGDRAGAQPPQRRPHPVARGPRHDQAGGGRLHRAAHPGARPPDRRQRALDQLPRRGPARRGS